MRRNFKLISLVASLALLAGCATANSTVTTATNAPASPSVYQQLDFTKAPYSIQTLEVDGKSFKVRAYEKVSYVTYPVNPAYQVMNIYIPDAYFTTSEATPNLQYNAQSAPIMFYNKVGGYMPALPATVSFKSISTGTTVMPPQGNMATPATASQLAGTPSQATAPTGMTMPPAGPGAPGAGPGGPDSTAQAMAQALARGYVVVSPGTRGRTQQENGVWTGKAPAVMVDLKAAVRYLKANDAAMPGNAQRIISVGTSAGGAVSYLLGASANAPEYNKYLTALGAAQASDDIFAVQAYCPISLLPIADAAYEWQFNGVNDYKTIKITMLDYNVQRQEIAGSLDAKQKQVSQDLKNSFPAVLNSLKLHNNGQALTLDAQGNGNFKDLVYSYVMKSAQQQLDAGKDLSSYKFLTIKNKQVVGIDIPAYVQYMVRLKTPPAFDALDLSSGENDLFGDTTTQAKHFTAYSAKNSTVADAKMADPAIVAMMDPYKYMTATTKERHVPQYWRIRHGTKDRDTSLAIPVILGQLAQANGFNVDLALPWDQGHGGNYDVNELFTWVDQIMTDAKDK